MVRKRIAAAMLAGMLVGVAPAGAALANHGSGPAGSHVCQGLVQARASVLGALGDGNGSLQSSTAHTKVAQKLIVHLKRCSSAGTK